MIRKQCSGLGMPLWPSSPSHITDWAAFDPAQCERVRIYFITSDGGSDQIRMRRLIKHATEFDVYTLVIDFSCTQHGGALVAFVTGQSNKFAFVSNAEHSIAIVVEGRAGVSART